jgi:hypothetical protein
LLWIFQSLPVALGVRIALIVSLLADKELNDRMNLPQGKPLWLTLKWVVSIGIHDMTIVIKDGADHHY